MPRLSPLSPLVLLPSLAALLSGCKTIYSDTYSNRHNYFKAPAEKRELTEAEKKAATAPVTPAPTAPLGLPAADAGAGAAPAPGMGSSPAAATPAIPGL